MSFSMPIVLVFKKKKKEKKKKEKVRTNNNNLRDEALERNIEAQKCCGLLNKTHYFTIYYQNK